MTDAELITRLEEALAGLLNAYANPPGRSEVYAALLQQGRAALALLSEPRGRVCYALLDVAPPAYSRTGGRVIGLFWREEDAETEAERAMGRGDGPDLRVCAIDAPHWMPDVTPG